MGFTEEWGGASWGFAGEWGGALWVGLCRGLGWGFAGELAFGFGTSSVIPRAILVTILFLCCKWLCCVLICRAAVEEGKVIYHNIRNFVRFQLST